VDRIVDRPALQARAGASSAQADVPIPVERFIEPVGTSINDAGVSQDDDELSRNEDERDS